MIKLIDKLQQTQVLDKTELNYLLNNFTSEISEYLLKKLERFLKTL